MVENKKTLTHEGTLPIKVNKEVVAHLSVGLYRNFARAVKELISNSYDAGAREVKIKLDLKNKQIIVRDDGRGMSKDEIEEKFLHIANRTLPSEDVDNLGRKRIGTFGIGFLATFPYCKEFELITKKKGNNEIISVRIDTEQFFSKLNHQITDIRVPFTTSPSDLPKDKGETIIILKNIANQIINELQEESKDNSSIEKMGGFGKFRWTLAQYAPIQYPPNRNDLRKFFSDPQKTPMSVWLNAEELFRNVPENAKILENDVVNFGKIEVKYAILSPFVPVKPTEAKGLQIRLRDVAVGFPTDFEIIKVTNKVPGKLNYLCGEVQILKGLSSALMIDRDSFSFTEDIAKLHDFFRNKLNVWNDKLEKFADNDKKIYEIFSDIPNSERILNELKTANIIHLPRERLRISKPTTISQSKNNKTASISDKVKEAFSKQTDFKVIENFDFVTEKKSPVKINNENKTVTIYNHHPDFIEKIHMDNDNFNVQYDEWDIHSTPFSICKILKNDNIVVFNTKHPLFKTKLNDEIIKRLSLGFLLILKKSNDYEALLTKFNHLLEDAFLESKNE